MTSQEREAEASLEALDAPGLKAVRVLYPDLHGVARGKDIPLRHFPALAAEGVTFCAAVMGTDLRHTPVVGGEVADLNVLALAVARPEVVGPLVGRARRAEREQAQWQAGDVLVAGDCDVQGV